MWEDLLNLIYPRGLTCINCNCPLLPNQPYELCTDCFLKIQWIGDESPILASVEYNEIIRKLIFRFKYKGQTYLAQNIAQIMAELLQERKITADFLIPIPLHKKRQAKRGFNQAELLSKYIQNILKIPLLKNCLIRQRNTVVMHELSKEQRKKNVENAFEIVNAEVLIDKDILLIDDIYTTGATAKACQKILMEAGAKSIKICTFAKGVLKQK